MKAPDTSPRWDWSSWQIDATPRALRTAAREGAPGREGATQQTLQKEGLCIRHYASLSIEGTPSPECRKGFLRRAGLT